MLKKKRIKYSLLGMIIAPPFGWTALTMMSVEFELYVLMAPMLVGMIAGFLIGRGKDQLMDSLSQFRSILDATPFGTIQCDSNGELLFANKAICDYLDMQEQELLGKLIWNCCSSDAYQNSLQNSFVDLVQTKKSSESVVCSLLSATGRKVKVEINWAYHETPVAAYTATIIDITSQVHSQRLLKKLSEVVEHADELIMITDRNGTIEYVNPALESKSGYSSQEFIGAKPSILKSPAQDPSVYKQLWKKILSGQTWRGSLVDRHKEGHFYPVEMSVTPILDEHGKIAAFVSIQQDKTAHQELEEQLRQSQKMEALGTLVGGIAHDFNNMLAALSGNAYLAKASVNDVEKHTRYMNNLDSLVDRAADMVKQLLTFARKDKVEKRYFSLNQFMADGYRLSKSVIPENIEHVTDFCSEELVIYGNTTQFQQVMMNLVNNACDAVASVQSPQTGCSLNRFEMSKAFRTAHPGLKGSSFARISVSDNGSGIEKERLTKVFEPFFTTKGVGEGTGLGLAMVYGAVSAHGGAIEVESKVGKGTTFHIYLPLSERKIEVSDVVEEIVPLLPGGETILLVDDDDALRNTIREALESLDYKVIEAVDGEQALQVFNNRSKEINIIITDVVMPKMGGFDFIKSVRVLNQNIPVIYITGYDGGSVQLKDPSDMKFSCIVNKPFSIPALSHAIREMFVVK